MRSRSSGAVCADGMHTHGTLLAEQHAAARESDGGSNCDSFLSPDRTAHRIATHSSPTGCEARRRAPVACSLSRACRRLRALCAWRVDWRGSCRHANVARTSRECRANVHRCPQLTVYISSRSESTQPRSLNQHDSYRMCVINGSTRQARNRMLYWLKPESDPSRASRVCNSTCNSV